MPRRIAVPGRSVGWESGAGGRAHWGGPRPLWTRSRAQAGDCTVRGLLICDTGLIHLSDTHDSVHTGKCSGILHSLVNVILLLLLCIVALSLQ